MRMGRGLSASQLQTQALTLQVTALQHRIRSSIRYMLEMDAASQIAPLMLLDSIQEPRIRYNLRRRITYVIAHVRTIELWVI